ncbi:MAG: hypothetical protein JKX97_03300 [Candidatus Lindowbacteria bacterium]|nr:hypothetical protein [Candidatus Lindowbacteria bacterium]
MQTFLSATVLAVEEMLLDSICAVSQWDEMVATEKSQLIDLVYKSSKSL